VQQPQITAHEPGHCEALGSTARTRYKVHRGRSRSPAARPASLPKSNAEHGVCIYIHHICHCRRAMRSKVYVCRAIRGKKCVYVCILHICYCHRAVQGKAHAPLLLSLSLSLFLSLFLSLSLSVLCLSLCLSSSRLNAAAYVAYIHAQHIRTRGEL
jgi:hypothetical protein